MKLITTRTIWNKSFDAHSSVLDTVRSQAHLMACSALSQCEQKNTNWLNEYVTLLAGKRVLSQVKLVEWVHANSPMRFSFKEKTFAYSDKAKNQKYDHINAQAAPFFDTEKTQPPKKLRTIEQAATNFATAIARRIMCDESSLDEFSEYPAVIREAITTALAKQGTQDWADEYLAQSADNT